MKVAKGKQREWEREQLRHLKVGGMGREGGEGLSDKVVTYMCIDFTRNKILKS